MLDVVAAFERQTGDRLMDELLRNTDDYLAANEDVLKRDLGNALERFLSDAARRQAKGELPAAVYLTISLLYTSVYFGNPRLLLELYDENWVLGKAFYAVEMNGEEFFRFWRDYEEKLITASGGERAWIRPSHLRQMKYHAIRQIAYLAATRIKYCLRYLEEIDALRSLEKGHAFYVTCGEYLGWQNTVAALMPGIDIFNCDPEEPLDHRTFCQCKYENKKFCKLDLHGGRFFDCTFKECIFSEVDLRDVLFENCKLTGVIFEDCKLPGGLFHTTLLEASVFRRILAIADESAPKEWYKVLEFSDCNLHQIEFEDCRLGGCLLNGCRTEGIDIRGGGCEESDFVPWITGFDGGKEGV